MTLYNSKNVSVTIDFHLLVQVRPYIILSCQLNDLLPILISLEYNNEVLCTKKGNIIGFFVM